MSDYNSMSKRFPAWRCGRLFVAIEFIDAHSPDTINGVKGAWSGEGVRAYWWPTNMPVCIRIRGHRGSHRAAPGARPR